MKFAHLGDCHLGGWRQPELKALNLESFKAAISICIKEALDFILIAGDLFDSAYPPIDILKETFQEFRRLKEANIPVFLIAGSHDYSVSGKTFLDVLQKAGFCTDVFQFEERDNKIILQPTIYKNIAIYGYPGKKSGLELEELERLKLQDTPGLFKILMLHTTLRESTTNFQIPSINRGSLPNADYIALGHLHIPYNNNGAVYCGPTFPNSIQELEDLKGGSFYIVDTAGRIAKQDIKLKEVLALNIQLKNSLSATEEILSALEKEPLEGKILVLRLSGILELGKISDIDFVKIENYAKNKKVYSFIRSTSKLFLQEPEAGLELLESSSLEQEIIATFQKNNPAKFNFLISELILALQAEKLEDERSNVFEDRVISDAKKVLQI